MGIHVLITIVSLHSHAAFVNMFNGLNITEWSEQVAFHLGVLDLDLALLEDKPADIMDTSSDEEKLFHKTWTRSNRLSFIFMQMTIANNIKTTIELTESAKEYLKLVEERFWSADKPLAGTLMFELTNMKFTETASVQEHIN